MNPCSVDADVHEPASLTCVMSTETYALLAQIVPVFLLIFAVRGSFLTAASVQDVKKRPKRLRRRHWNRDPRLHRGVLVLLFLGFEFCLVLGAAGVWMMPSVLVWICFALTLVYAAVEFWIAGVVPNGHNSESD